MPEKAQPQPSPEVREFPHIFTEVVFQLVPEVNYENLVRLTQLIKINNSADRYMSLCDALRKLQWAKLSGMEAVEVENDIAEDKDDGNISINPICQAQHAKSLYEFITHTKSSLDYLAIFLAGLFSLSAKGEERDLMQQAFRNQIIEKDAETGGYIKSLESWFLEIQQRKDKWASRSSTRVFLIPESADIGLLPIAKVVMEDYALQDLPPTSKYYWATPEFIELNFNKLASFFNLLVERCISLELTKIEKPPTPPAAVGLLSAFPLRLRRDTDIAPANKP